MSLLRVIDVSGLKRSFYILLCRYNIRMFEKNSKFKKIILILIYAIKQDQFMQG